MATEDQVPTAASLTVGYCACGCRTIVIRLHGEDGEVFATAGLTTDVAAIAATDIQEVLQHLGLSQAEAVACEGSA